jgi:alpha-L-fucosidase
MSQRKARALATCLLISTILTGAVPPGAAQAPANVPDRLQWFREAKFGLFIHWGAYAIVGREEWARQLLQIPREEYRTLALGFDPVAFDPDAWAALAKDAGAKYVVITSKHHDGFAIYDSAFPTSTSCPRNTARTSWGRSRPR